MNNLDNYNRQEKDFNSFSDANNSVEQLTDTYQNQLAAASKTLMTKVYGWMCGALAITALTALYCANSVSIMDFIFSSKITFWGLLILEFGLVVGVTAMIEKLSLRTATLLFVLYSIVNGLTLSVIFFAYSISTIATTFFITAGMFGGMALYGTLTKKDLSSWGGFLFMALIGLILASIVNIFLHNSMFDLIVSVIGVFIFVGLTAFDAQKIKSMLANAEDLSEGNQKIALLGSLSLYLDFINMFLYLLRIFGRK